MKAGSTTTASCSSATPAWSNSSCAVAGVTSSNPRLRSVSTSGAVNLTSSDIGIPAAVSDETVVAFTVVEVQPPTRFSFRWTHPAGEEAVEGNSLLVTFELVPQGAGTLVRFRETGFRERGWTAAAEQATYEDHVHGWDYFLPRLVTHAAALGARP